jgi:hypothetical protein
MDLLTRSSEILTLGQSLLKNIGTPLLVLAWCMAIYTVLDILKSVFTDQPTQLWSLGMVKGATDAFFYVALTETVGKWIRGRDINSALGIVRRLKVISSQARQTIYFLNNYMAMINSINLHKMMGVYLIFITLTIFYITQQILIHIVIIIANFAIYTRIKGISEYPALPGTLKVINGKHGYVEFEKTEFTGLESLVRVDWLAMPGEEKSDDFENLGE